MSKSVIFYVSKDTGRFRSYHIVDGVPREEVEESIKNFNVQQGGYILAHIITNQHVIDAIIQKESTDTVSGRVRELKNELRDLSSDIENIRGSVDGLIRFIKGDKDE